MKNFEPGTISHGTLRTEDLVLAFADEIHRLLCGTYEHPEVDLKRVKGFVENPSSADEYDLEELFDILDSLAPEGYYFGAHPGDGADFGFWEVENE